MRHRDHQNEATGQMGGCAFMAGALIGGAVALLLAPQAGAELRGMLSNYASRAKENVLERAEEAFDEEKEVVQDAGQSAKEFAKQAQEVVGDAGRSAKEFAKQAPDMAREPGRSAL